MSDHQLHPWINVASRALIPYYKILHRWTKGNRDEQKSKLKTKDMRMNISSFLMVWIYTSNTLILGLTKETQRQNKGYSPL